jgi:hypothetical protein
MQPTTATTTTTTKLAIYSTTTLAHLTRIARGRTRVQYIVVVFNKPAGYSATNRADIPNLLHDSPLTKLQ